ncbi:hypothetical protein LCL95_05555 [Bacillus timonensis]|nr:hypothetical protein [Bacillus timonensis]
MKYILDQANVLKENRITSCSILVNNNEIEYISPSMDRLQFMKMNLSNYILTPGHVMLDFSLSVKKTFPEYKRIMQSEYIEKGCTTLIIISSIQYEREISIKIAAANNLMLNSPLDYYIGIKMPLNMLTPSIIRTCAKNKVPMLIVEIENEAEITNLAWGWIRDAYYSYSLPIVPMWKETEQSKKKAKKQKELWNTIMKENRIPHLPYCPPEYMALSKDTLCKIGVYPSKGDIRIGGQVDYNLYEKKGFSYSVEEFVHVDYHSHIPLVTMHKGKVLKAGNKQYYRPGFGTECIVKMPGHFASSF